MKPPLPKEIKEAFEKAIYDFSDWVAHGSGEPYVQLEPNRKRVKISEVCTLVLEFDDQPLSENVAAMLWRLPDPTSRDLKANVRDKPTYHVGAYCLAELIEKENRRRFSPR